MRKDMGGIRFAAHRGKKGQIRTLFDTKMSDRKLQSLILYLWGVTKRVLENGVTDCIDCTKDNHGYAEGTKIALADSKEERITQ